MLKIKFPVQGSPYSTMISKGVVVLLLLGLALNADALRNYFLGKLFKKQILKNVETIKDVKSESFTQILDHFDPTNTATWQQKYLVNEQPGNIVFLMIEGEGPMSPFPGLWTTLAAEVGATTFQLEHRFYGTSQPFDTLSTENLKYLSSDQALADCATFISAMNEKYEFGENATWIAFGGSYSGSLAAWLRYKYPHLVHGAVSSSGPLEAILDFGEYLQVVVNDVADDSQECIDALSVAFTKIQEAVANGDTAHLVQDLFLCEEFTQESASDPLESASFYGTLTDSLALVAQYNGLLGVDISDVCSLMVSEDLGDELSRYSSVIELVLPLLTDGECLDYSYNASIQDLKEESLDSDAAQGSRQWIYQTCTEFGFYQTTDDVKGVLGDTVTLDLFTSMCKDIYGDNFDEEFVAKAINNTNILKGSTNLEVTNVVFVHGSHDPWHPLGITESSEKAGPAILINGTSHCNDMYNPNVINNEELQSARTKIRELVLQWISDK